MSDQTSETSAENTKDENDRPAPEAPPPPPPPSPPPDHFTPDEVRRLLRFVEESGSVPMEDYIRRLERDIALYRRATKEPSLSERLWPGILAGIGLVAMAMARGK